MRRRVPSIERINALLGWRPDIPLDQTILRIRDNLQAEGDGPTAVSEPDTSTGPTPVRVMRIISRMNIGGPSDSRQSSSTRG